MLRPPPAADLKGRRLLVVEDDFLIATEPANTLEARGAVVLALAGSVADALRAVATLHDLDGAVLDINLRGQLAYPVADALLQRNVPFVFTTGYDPALIPAAYAQMPRCEKPVTGAALARALTGPRSG